MKKNSFYFKMSYRSELTGPQSAEDTLRNVMSINPEGFSQSLYHSMMLDLTDKESMSESDEEDEENEEFHETINEESVLRVATPARKTNTTSRLARSVVKRTAASESTPAKKLRKDVETSHEEESHAGSTVPDDINLRKTIHTASPKSFIEGVAFGITLWTRGSKWEFLTYEDSLTITNVLKNKSKLKEEKWNTFDMEKALSGFEVTEFEPEAGPSGVQEVQLKEHAPVSLVSVKVEKMELSDPTDPPIYHDPRLDYVFKIGSRLITKGIKIQVSPTFKE